MDITKLQDIYNSSKVTPLWVNEARALNREYEALVFGKNFEELMCKISGKEDEKKLIARRKYARSTKDLIQRILRVADNIYSATGGTKIYGEDNIDVIKKISSVRDNKSLESWLSTNWFNRLYMTDPNGIVIYEWNDEDLYPTSKTIHCIKNYVSNGQNIEWILFEPKNVDGIDNYRLIDADFDYTFVVEDGICKIIEDKTYINPFGCVPGIINSDIEIIGSEIRQSPLEYVFEIIKEYLRDLSIKNVFKNLHGMPILWRYTTSCPACHGTGKTGDSLCPDCDGTGLYVNKDITDMLTLGIPDGDSPKITPDIAGYISPDLNTWEQYNKELNMLESLAHNTMWGTHLINEKSETATGRYIDTQPVINKLNMLADTCQWVEWRLTQLAAKFIKPEESNNIVVLYGRNYIIEQLSILLERYNMNRKDGDNTVILDKLFIEWLTSKYKYDPQTLAMELKKSQVEPFLHNTVAEIFDIFGSYEAKKKMLFPDFWASLENGYIIAASVDMLKNDFKRWLDENIQEKDIEENNIEEK